MRLVNKEFELRVSQYLFTVVVVPFKPEIYGINTEPALSGTPVSQGAILLQDKGMRVFQGYFSMQFLFRCLPGLTSSFTDLEHTSGSLP
jgi:hypothetical protein